MTRQPSTPWLRTAALALLLGYWTALTLGTHWPIPPELLRLGESDKVLHFAAYFGLALLACVNWALWRPLGWRPGVVIVTIAAALAAADELTQPPFGRYCDFYDWVADLIGALAAVGIFSPVAAAILRQRQSLHRSS